MKPLFLLLFFPIFLFPFFAKAQVPSQRVTVENTTFIFSIGKGSLWERAKTWNTKQNIYVTIIEDGKKKIQKEEIFSSKLTPFMIVDTTEEDFFSLSEKEEKSSNPKEKIRTLSLVLNGKNYELICSLVFHPYGAKYAYKEGYCIGKCPLDAETINMAFHTIAITKMELKLSH